MMYRFSSQFIIVKIDTYPLFSGLGFVFKVPVTFKASLNLCSQKIKQELNLNNSIDFLSPQLFFYYL